MADINSEMLMWKQRLMVELRRDKKKTTLMAVLLVVAMFLVGRITVRSGGPQRVMGATLQNGISTTSASRAIPAPPGERDSGWAKKTRPGKSVERKFERDIFTPDWEMFSPSSESQDDPIPFEAVDEENELTKARTILLEAEELTLQSTVQSDRPTAVINGTLLRVGGRIEEFKVVAIRADACDVKKNGVEVTLFLKE